MGTCEPHVMALTLPKHQALQTWRGLNTIAMRSAGWNGKCGVERDISRAKIAFCILDVHVHPTSRQGYDLSTKKYLVLTKALVSTGRRKDFFNSPHFGKFDAGLRYLRFMFF